MRLVVCLFAEAKQLLPVIDPVYARSYGVRTLYELLEEAVRDEGGAVLMHRQGAWPRLMGLFRIIHNGSPHGQFPLRSYGGALFRPGDAVNPDGVVRGPCTCSNIAGLSVSDMTVHQVLRKLLRGPLPVLRGRQKTFVEGPVDYTDLRTEFIGLIYEGLLDYRLQRSNDKTGPLLFLNLGREPVLPLARLGGHARRRQARAEKSADHSPQRKKPQPRSRPKMKKPKTRRTRRKKWTPAVRWPRLPSRNRLL